MGSIGPTYETHEEFTPNLYPVFPESAKPCAELATFSLQKLEAGDIAEQARLFEVCQTTGFFLLNFDSTSRESLPEDAEAIGRLSETMFKNLTLEEKKAYPQFKKPYSLLGYKPVGWSKTDSKGTPDTTEFMNIGKDDILNTPGRIPTEPPAIVFEPQNRELLARYQTSCHRLGLDLLSILATHLGLPSDSFEDKCSVTQPCDSHVRMTRGPARNSIELPEIQTPGHTDFGAITILFNWLGGLQIWSEPSRGNFHTTFDGTQPASGGEVAQWLWVKPEPGHAIINLGDAAVTFSGRLLRSARHRVVLAPGEQGLWPRYSIVYFVRPGDKVKLERMKGGIVPEWEEGDDEEGWTSQQWIERQAKQIRDGGRKD